MKKQTLDFVIIGAQKAGTTSLFHYLREHPGIFMPPQKEIPFFSSDTLHKKGLSWFLEAYYADASPDQLWGKATPQYMVHSATVASRLARYCPQIRLIAILRDPIARAYSHYRMSVRRGFETRSFEEAVREQLKPENLHKYRLHHTERDGYVVRGEYGRILSDYIDFFPPAQLLVLYTEHLEKQPVELFLDICRFLQVETILPGSLGQRFYQGGTRQRIPKASFVVNSMPTAFLRRVIPLRIWRYLQSFYIRFEQWNTIPEDTREIPLSSGIRSALASHYKTDSSILTQVLGIVPPWLERWL